MSFTDYLPWGVVNFVMRGVSLLRELLSGSRIVYTKADGFITILTSSPKPILMLNLNTSEGEVSILEKVYQWNHRFHQNQPSIKDMFPSIGDRKCNIVLINGVMEDDVGGDFCVPI